MGSSGHPSTPADGRIEISTAALRVVVNLDRGGDIEFVGVPEGENVLFHADWDAPIPAGRSMTYGSGTLDWLSHYRGGWQVMFPNAGSECVANGVPHPLHGEVSSAPAELVEVSGRHLVLRSATRLPVRLERRLQLAPRRAVLFVEERAINLSDQPQEYAWGHHPAFAVKPGARIDLPAGPVHVDEDFDDPASDLEAGGRGSWPEAPGRGGGTVSLDRVPQPPTERVCYLPDRPRGWAAIRHASEGTGVALAWEPEAFPHMWLWQHAGGRRFPFYGRATMVGLEPVSCWPGDGLAKAIERGRQRTLQPRECRGAWVTLALFDGSAGPVRAVSRSGHVRVSDSAGD